MAFEPEIIRKAQKHLRQSDVVMKKIIADVGRFNLKIERNRFWMLVRSIISQQISVGAARSIRNKFESVLGDGGKTPERILSLRSCQLRSAGLSPQKIKYITDLAQKADDGTIHLKNIGRKSDEEIIKELIQVKGIGRWTSQMFLMFSLGRLDVFPSDDLGIKNAIQSQYGLRKSPNEKMLNSISSAWRPFATVACWYCWRSLDVDSR